MEIMAKIRVRLDIDLISEELYQVLLAEFTRTFGEGYYDNWVITADKEEKEVSNECKSIQNYRDEGYITCIHNPNGSIKLFHTLEEADNFANNSKLSDDLRVISIKGVEE